MNHLFARRRKRSTRDIVLILALAIVVAGVTWIASGCGSPEATHAGALPDISLVDQNGKPVVLSSLKGKPLLVDFIYTSCPGPCRTLTQSMERIAQKLGPALGQQVTFVSISIDPEHEGPPQLLSYSKALDANRAGWFFLSGSPDQIDATLSAFGLRRERAPGGDIEHFEEVILVGADGREFKVYKGDVLHTDSVLADLQEAAHG
ncbi:MAG: SCO family protein [Deltaproteobacteria bacterium]|jgi:protein SCO1|nr:SCO family protein [Deltaproteobacteria bacterium]